MSVGKRPCLIFHTECESEYITPEAEKEYSELIDLEKKRKLRDMFPHENQPRASNHHTMDMLYVDPYAPPEDRVYQPGVLIFESKGPDYICEIPLEGSSHDTLKHFKRWLRLIPNKKAKLDERNGLTLEEFERMLPTKEVAKK